MGNGLTGLLFGIGFAGWIYTMMMRRTGSQVKASLITAAVGGLIGFFVIYTMLGLLFE